MLERCTFRGVPTALMPYEDLLDCVNEGFEILDAEGQGVDEVSFWVRLRLEIEVIRRREGIPIRGY